MKKAILTAVVLAGVLSTYAQTNSNNEPVNNAATNKTSIIIDGKKFPMTAAEYEAQRNVNVNQTVPYTQKKVLFPVANNNVTNSNGNTPAVNNIPAIDNKQSRQSTTMTLAVVKVSSPVPDTKPVIQSTKNIPISGGNAGGPPTQAYQNPKTEPAQVTGTSSISAVNTSQNVVSKKVDASGSVLTTSVPKTPSAGTLEKPITGQNMPEAVVNPVEKPNTDNAKPVQTNATTVKPLFSQQLASGSNAELVQPVGTTPASGTTQTPVINADASKTVPAQEVKPTVIPVQPKAPPVFNQSEKPNGKE